MNLDNLELLSSNDYGNIIANIILGRVKKFNLNSYEEILGQLRFDSSDMYIKFCFILEAHNRDINPIKNKLAYK